MSNYHLEPADEPRALTKEAIKALRHDQVQGLSRRRLLRTSLGAGVGLWLLEVTAGSIGFLWPNLSGGFGSKVTIGTFTDLKAQNTSLPIDVTAEISETGAIVCGNLDDMLVKLEAMARERMASEAGTEDAA